MKKLLRTLFAFVLIVPMVFTMAACGEETPTTPEQGTITGAEINGTYYTSEYVLKGTELNTVKLVYDNGTKSEAITINEDTVKGYDKTQIGTQTITITYNEKEYKFDIFVAARKVDVSSIDALYTAINNQAEGDFIKIADGNFYIDYENYSDNKNIEINDGSNTTTYSYSDFYFLINKDHVKVAGSGNTLLSSREYQINGNWNYQDFITICASDVTIDNLNLISKCQVNKVIEVFYGAKDFRLTNTVISAPEDESIYGEEYAEKFAGSVYFYSSDIGSVLISNVTLNKGRITFTGAQTGTVTFENTKINYTNLDDWVYGYDAAFRPFSFRKDKDIQFVNSAELTIDLDENEWSAENYQTVLDNIPDGAVVK